jgi:Holliday junction resolvase
MRESAIEKAVCDHARANGCMVMKLAGPNQKGQPDRMFLKNGRVLFLEFKAPGKLPTALQESWMARLRAQGFNAFACDSIQNGIFSIESILLR